MNHKPLSAGIRTGLVFGVVIVFLFLIGFMNTSASLIAKFLGSPTPTNSLPQPIFYVLFMLLVGLWCGIAAARSLNDEARAPQRLTAALSAGLLLALMAGLTGFIFGSLKANGVDPRTYLVALSPDTIQLYLFNQTQPLTGALLLAGSLVGSALLGAGIWLAWRVRLAGLFIQVISRTAGLSQSPAVKQVISSPWARYAAWAALAAALILLPRTWGSYWNYVLGTVGIYVLLGLGINIITGWAGQLVIGYVAFFGVGAYTFALLSAPEPHQITLNFWLALLAGVLAAALVGLLIGLPILNLRGDYLAIVTLGFAEIVRILFKSDLLTWLTGGPKGIRDIGGPTLLGRSFNSDIDFMYLIIIAVLVVVFIANRLQRSRTGRAWEAIREDETVARATGVNAFASKLLALALSAGIAGLAGVLFASRNQFTGPEDHSLMVAINVICLMIVGGIGNIPGIILGAFALKGLPEILREVDNFRMLAFGALLVIMMNMRPEGFLPARRPKFEKPGDSAAPEKAEAAAVEQKG